MSEKQIEQTEQVQEVVEKKETTKKQSTKAKEVVKEVIKEVQVEVNVDYKDLYEQAISIIAGKDDIDAKLRELISEEIKKRRVAEQNLNTQKTSVLAKLKELEALLSSKK